MTDRVNSILVVLDIDRRDDDCQPIMDAILQIKGVLRVSPNVSSIDSHVAEQRVRIRVARELGDLAQSLLREDTS